MKYQNCFYCDDTFLLDKKVSEEINKLTNKITDYNLFSYDFSENSFSSFCEQISTPSFFSDSKIVVVSGIYDLKNVSDYELDIFLNYLKKDDSPISLIIKLNTPFKKDYSKICSLIYKYVKITNLSAPLDDDYLKSIEKNILKDGYSIKKEDLEYLFLKVNKSYARFENEILKLKLFKLDDKIISKQDIETAVSADLESNIFKISNYLLGNDKKNLIKVYNNLILKNIKPTQILNLIFKRLYQLLVCIKLLKKGKIKDDIAGYLNISSGQLFYLLNDIKKTDKNYLIDKILYLAEIDYMIKKGYVDPNYALELFLIRS